MLSREKFRKYIPQDQTIDFVEWYDGISEKTIVTEHVVACHDPKEDKFLSVAFSGKADCIITGDHHLLDVIKFKSIPILPSRRVHTPVYQSGWDPEIGSSEQVCLLSEPLRPATPHPVAPSSADANPDPFPGTPARRWGTTPARSSPSGRRRAGRASTRPGGFRA
jgi:hypothetical protein